MKIKPEIFLSSKRVIAFNKVLITGLDESLISYVKDFVISDFRKRDFFIDVSGNYNSGVVGNLFALIMPESVVKDFFLTSITFDLGGLVNNELGVLIIDLKVIVLKFGLSMSFNFTSVVGIAVAYYILRYLR